MTSDGSPVPDAVSGIDPLWNELARDHRDLLAVPPVLRHLVVGQANALFGDEPIARTRAMVESLARELLRSVPDATSPADLEELVKSLIELPALLGHIHAQAIEGQLVVRLAENGIDPLLPPLVQDRISADDPLIAGLAMNLMVAQTRFVRRQQRMELVAAELPADLLHDSLARLTAIVGSGQDGAVAAIRAGFDERRGRIGLLAQLGLGLGDDFPAALDPSRAGFSLFATALSLITGHDRDAVVLASASGRPLRLALLLAAAGVEPASRESVVLQLHPDALVQPEWFSVPAEQAAGLLAQGQAE